MLASLSLTYSLGSPRTSLGGNVIDDAEAKKMMAAAGRKHIE